MLDERRSSAPARKPGGAGRGRLAGQEPPETWCRPGVSERDRQARCIFAQAGHRKSPAEAGLSFSFVIQQRRACLRGLSNGGRPAETITQSVAQRRGSRRSDRLKTIEHPTRN